jgi:hypothetical protein
MNIDAASWLLSKGGFKYPIYCSYKSGFRQLRGTIYLVLCVPKHIPHTPTS